MPRGAGRIVPFFVISVALHASVLATTASQWPTVAPAPTGGDARTVSVRLQAASKSAETETDEQRQSKTEPKHADTTDAATEEPRQTVDRDTSKQPDSDRASKESPPKKASKEPRTEPERVAQITKQAPSRLRAETPSPQKPEQAPKDTQQDKAARQPESKPTPKHTSNPAPSSSKPAQTTDPSPDPSVAQAQATDDAADTSVTQGDSGSAEQAAPTKQATAEQTRRIRSKVAERLTEYFHYPRLAQRQGWEGRVVLAFEVRPDGSVSHVRVIDSSGRAILDEAAREALQRVERVPGIADESLRAPVALELPVTYRLRPA